MKRSILLAILACVLLSTPLLAAEGCTVNSMAGTPQVLRENEPVPFQAGDNLKKGDLILTEPGGQMDMSMNDLAGIRILPESKIEITGWKQEKMGVRIVDGNIILNLKKLPDTAVFQVETPTAIAAVRGTQFWGRVQNPSDLAVTTFAVREGEVSIQPTGTADTSPILLKAGDALDIPKDSGVFTVRPALPEEMQAMEQASGIPMEIAQAG